MDKKLSAFNYSRNREKLLTNLINLIEGIICDGEVDTRELVFLDTWLLESEIICENYCVDAIRTKIAAILEDGVIEKEELTQFKIDLIDIQQNLLDTPDIDLYSSES
ncbi:TPA: NAD-dependent DNA ligase, partial [Yersinia enterocolitica]|nr:NAD-dependent DNA ligase [Yersinia enterocolitica]